VLTKTSKPAARNARVWIAHRSDDAGNTRLKDLFRAGAGAADVTAWFKGAVESRAAGVSACIPQRYYFSVRPSRGLVITAAHYDTVGRNDNGADHRVRAGAAAPTFGKQQRTRHEVGVGYHFSSNNASTYSSAENGIRSSIFSPTPT
jgi:hypothetical protein